MTGAPIYAVAADRSVDLPRRMRGLRTSRRGRWLAHPSAYTLGTIVASILSVGTSLVAPSLLGPAAFGSFALLTSLFQYASRFDLGLSQLADRELANETPVPGRDGDILWASWAAGAIVLLVIVPLCTLAAAFSSEMRPLDTALAIGGGGLAMIANAPVTIFRAGARIWEFTAVALTLQAGMTLPRLAGLVVAGITGCFAVLLAWYATLVFIFARPVVRPPSLKLILSLWRAAFPLFLFNAAWLVYLTANRWIAALVTVPEELGFFAFGANLAFVGLGIVSTIAQVYYPRLLARIHPSSKGECSGTIALQALIITAALAATALVAICFGVDLIALIFPRYLDAAASTVVMAISCVPLALATWLMPICIAISSTPVRDAARLFLPAYATLLAAMISGHLLAGTEGLAWGCVVAGTTLLISVLAHLRQNAIVSAGTAIRITVVQTAIIVGLSALAFSALPHPKGGLFAAAEAGDSGGPPVGWKLAFDEQFDSLRMWDPAKRAGLWEPHYPWGGRNNPSNEELQYYVDPRPGRDPKPIAALNPFSIEQGRLLVRARRVASEQQAMSGFPFASGLLTTAPTFSFTYGYVEIKARVPRGRGLWSAFWLAPIDQSWPPEIDILEALGHDTRSYVMTAHRNFVGFHSQSQFRAQTPDLAENFHVYAVRWTEKEIVWFFDGARVAAMPTPSDTHKPMYMILNLAVGGHWPGSPDAATVFPATLEVDYIRAYLPPEAKQ